jgi:tRNA A-37 threonylcarbamoyl transferase component Bud32
VTATATAPAPEPVRIDGASPVMSRLTLQFPPEVETAFREQHFARSARASRVLLGLGTLLYLGAFLPLDWWFLPPDTFAAVTTIRVPTGLLLVGFFLSSFSGGYARRWQLTVIGTIVVVAIGSITAATIARDTHVGYSAALAFMLFLMVTFTVGRLRLTYASVTGMLLIAIYNGAILATGARLPSQLMVENMMMLSAALLGFSAAYLLEHTLRSDFLSSLLLEKERADLRDANQLLERRNAELARSREQVVRSARRTELVFLALTDALPGTILDDKYRIEEKIGSGSFGTVYRATHMQLDTPVAVKVLRPYQGQDEIGVLERLRQEGVSVWRLRHPNIVAVLDFSVAHDAVAYLVMELLVGHSLADELRTHKPMPVGRVVEVIAPVCHALAEAHAQGIIHRDIKPSNIFLHQGTSGEVVKLIDFGIAKMLDEELAPGSDRRTATGLLLGTPAYFAPERLSGEPYGGAVDVYAVGVILYEMVAGRLPFPTPASSSGENDWITALMRLGHQPPPLGEVNPGVPADLASLVERALAIDPAERPSAAAIAEGLAQAVTRSPGAPGTP